MKKVILQNAGHFSFEDRLEAFAYELYFSEPSTPSEETKTEIVLPLKGS